MRTMTEIKSNVMSGQPANRQPQLVRLSDVEPERVDWLWHPYIPRGKLTILEGHPGLGKTFMMLTISAAVTQGWPLLGQDGKPGCHREPGTVLYLTAEDGLGDTLRPRLDAAGADVSRVVALTGWRVTDEQGQETEGAVTLGDIAVLEQAIQEHEPILVVIDPLSAFLGADVDMHRANEVRPVLAAAGRLVEKYGAALVIVRHLSKAIRDNAVLRGAGSLDFAAAARSIILCAEHDGARVVAHVKSNLAPHGVSLRYDLQDDRLECAGTSDLRADDLQVKTRSEHGDAAVDDADEFLTSYLKDGPQPATEVTKAAALDGIKKRTLDRAKKRVGVVSRRQSKDNKGGGGWIWELPPQQPQAPALTRTEEAGDLAMLQEDPAADANSQGRQDELLAILPADVPDTENRKIARLPTTPHGDNGEPDLGSLQARTESGEFDGIALDLGYAKYEDVGRNLRSWFKDREQTGPNTAPYRAALANLEKVGQALEEQQITS